MDKVAALVAESHRRAQRFDYLSKVGRASRPAAPSADIEETNSLNVTGRATKALKNVLEGLARQPNQALRLQVGDDGQTV